MTDDVDQEYDEDLVNLLELVWGEGYLSPGGENEIARIMDGVNLNGKRILDIGCGSGGIDRLLVNKYGAAHVVGVDVEPTLVEKSTLRATQEGLEDRLSFQHIQPGPIPFADGSFALVFSKDAIIHIPDKAAVCRDIFRVLAPGGMFVGGDWMRGEGAASTEMTRYLRLEGLDFGMGSARDYERALAGAGFTDVRLTDRNEWYRDVAKKEHARLSGPLYQQIVAKVGKEFADHEIEVWEAMIVVLDKGELRPTHLRATKP